MCDVTSKEGGSFFGSFVVDVVAAPDKKNGRDNFETCLSRRKTALLKQIKLASSRHPAAECPYSELLFSVRWISILKSLGV